MRIRDDIQLFAACWHNVNRRACHRWRPVVNWAFGANGLFRSLALSAVGFAIRAECAPLMLRYWLGLPPPRGL